MYENVVDVLFLCFAVDCKYRDGSPGKEYFMDKSLMVRKKVVISFSVDESSRPQMAGAPERSMSVSRRVVFNWKMFRNVVLFKTF